MNPYMQVERRQEGKDRIYTLKLSRVNFNHFCAGCTEVDSLIGRCSDGVQFCIYTKRIKFLSTLV